MRLAKRWPRVRRMRSPDAYAKRVLVNLALDGSRRRERRRRELANPDRLDEMRIDGTAQRSLSSSVRRSPWAATRCAPTACCSRLSATRIASAHACFWPAARMPANSWR